MADAIELTGEERSKVDAARLTPRPEFFNGVTAQQQEISRDFESFIILQDPDTIKSTLDWLAEAGTLTELRDDRNAVLFEALVADIADREARQSEIADVTSEFNEWRANFQAGKFSDVPEVGLIIRDSQATAEELFVAEERANHLEAVQNRVTDRIGQDVSSAQLQELLSWPTPLLAY